MPVGASVSWCGVWIGFGVARFAVRVADVLLRARVGFAERGGSASDDLRGEATAALVRRAYASELLRVGVGRAQRDELAIVLAIRDLHRIGQGHVLAHVARAHGVRRVL